jgi:O-acetyl-ADP-ribose deacetylase (regulator of RNase III)
LPGWSGAEEVKHDGQNDDAGPAAEIAVKTVRDWMTMHPGVIDRVIFNVFKDEDKEYYEQELR